MNVSSLFNTIKIYKNPIYFYLNYLKLLGQKEARIDLRNGLSYWIRPSLSDIFILEEIFKTKDYDAVIPKKNNLDVVVDVGSHIGIFAVYISRYSKKVVAYEPDKDNLILLKKNIAVNNLHNIVIKPYAVADKKATLKLYKCPDNAAGNSLIDQYKGSISSYVQTVTLDEELSCFDKVDLLKMDCEGGEYSILYSLSKKTFNKLKKIILEYHDYASDTYDHNDLIILLRDLKFKTAILQQTKRKTGLILAYKP